MFSHIPVEYRSGYVERFRRYYPELEKFFPEREPGIEHPKERSTAMPSNVVSLAQYRRQRLMPSPGTSSPAPAA